MLKIFLWKLMMLSNRCKSLTYKMLCAQHIFNFQELVAIVAICLRIAYNNTILQALFEACRLHKQMRRREKAKNERSKTTREMEMNRREKREREGGGEVSNATEWQANHGVLYHLCVDNSWLNVIEYMKRCIWINTMLPFALYKFLWTIVLFSC